MHKLPDPTVDQLRLNQRSYDAIACQWQQARWLQRTLPEFELTEKFNAILLWDVLFHLPRSNHRTLLVGCQERLLPGARLMLTSGGLAGEAFTDTMFEHRFFHDSLAPHLLQSLLQEIGFHIELLEVMNPPTAGRDKGRIAIVARTTDTATQGT